MLVLRRAARSSLWLQHKGCRTFGSTSLDKIQAAYDRKVAAGHLESDKVQRRVLEYLAASLDQAAARAEALARGHAAAVAAASAAAADAAAAAAAEAATIATTTVTTATATTATTSTSSTATPSSATTSSTASSPPATSAPAQNESSASFLVMSGARGDVESVGKHSSWGKPGWVLPKTISGAGLSMAEDHRRVAQYTKQLAAENSRKVRAQADARQAASRGGTAAEQQAVAAPATATAAPSDPQSAPAAEEKAPPKQPVIKRSVYVHGSVGTGKTMMLDLFYDQAREAGLRTVRQHFYEFMIGFHKQIHLFSGDRPVEVAANMLADDIDVLCFDEFQITDIQDATILPRLFEVLFLRGVAVVMTSNTSPQLLYTGGLNRHVHLPPFVSTVGEHCTVLGLGGPGLERVDYRRKAEAAELAEEAAAGAEGDVGTSGAYLWGAGAEERLRLRWEELRVEEGSWPEKVVELQLPMGRTFRVPAAAGKSCLLTFEELCGKDRGEADFFALADRFRTVFVSGVPRFSVLEDTDMVRRFVKLLDVLYDRRARLVVAAAVPPGEIFDNMRSEVLEGDMEALAWRTALYSSDGKAGFNPSAIGTLCEAVRATDRAESRLREMRTRRYWERCGEA